MDDKKTEVYNALLKTGYTQSDIGTLDHFKSLLDVPEQRLNLYNDLQRIGYTKNDLGEFSQFETELMGTTPQVPIATSEQSSFYGGQFGTMVPIRRNVKERNKLVQKQYEQIENIRKDPQGAIVASAKGLTKAFASGIEKTATGVLQFANLATLAKPENVYQFQENAKSLYEFSTASDEYFDELLPVEDKWKNNFITGDIPQAIGSTLGFAAFGMVGKGLRLSGKIASGVAGAAVQAQSMGQEAYENTGDIDTALLASATGIPLGATEAFGLQTYFRILNKPAKRAFNEMLKTGFREGLEEFLQEGGQTFMENLVASSSVIGYDPERKLSEGLIRGSGAGFVSGFIMAGLGFGINHARNRNKNEVSSQSEGLISNAEKQTADLPSLNESLNKVESLVNQYIENTTKEIKLNAGVSRRIFNKNNDSIDKVNQSVANHLGLEPEQVSKFNDLLEQSDDGTIKDHIFQSNPQVLQDKSFLGKIIFSAIKNPTEFQQTYGIEVPQGLKQRYLNNVSQFLDEQGILSKQEIKNYERTKTPKAAIETTPLPKKVPSTPMLTESDTNYDENIWGINFQQEQPKGNLVLNKKINKYGEEEYVSPINNEMEFTITPKNYGTEEKPIINYSIGVQSKNNKWGTGAHTMVSQYEIEHKYATQDILLGLFNRNDISKVQPVNHLSKQTMGFPSAGLILLIIELRS